MAGTSPAMTEKAWMPGTSPGMTEIVDRLKINLEKMFKIIFWRHSAED